MTRTINRHALIRVAKWAWIVAVLVAVGYVFYHYWAQMQHALAHMSRPLLAGSALLTLLAKLLLGENARLAAARCGLPLPYPVALRLYNLSQLGKYIPGSIWQFVGRAGAYRERGAGFPVIRDSLLLESAWVVGSALILGIALAGPRAVSFFGRADATPVLYWFAGLLLVAVLCLAIGVAWRRAVLARYMRLALPPVRLLLVMLAVWVLLGVAFWSLTAGIGMRVGVPYSVGLFALAFALGFLVPIAPAGLGVRDGILVAGLLPYGPLQEVVAVTLVARVIYLVVELGLVAIQEFALAVATRLRPSSGQS